MVLFEYVVCSVLIEHVQHFEPQVGCLQRDSALIIIAIICCWAVHSFILWATPNCRHHFNADLRSLLQYCSFVSWATPDCWHSVHLIACILPYHLLHLTTYILAHFNTDLYSLLQYCLQFCSLSSPCLWTFYTSHCLLSPIPVTKYILAHFNTDWLVLSETILSAVLFLGQPLLVGILYISLLTFSLACNQIHPCPFQH